MVMETEAPEEPLASEETTNEENLNDDFSWDDLDDE